MPLSVQLQLGTHEKSFPYLSKVLFTSNSSLQHVTVLYAALIPSMQRIVHKLGRYGVFDRPTGHRQGNLRDRDIKSCTHCHCGPL